MVLGYHITNLSWGTEGRAVCEQAIRETRVRLFTDEPFQLPNAGPEYFGVWAPIRDQNLTPFWAVVERLRPTPPHPAREEAIRSGRFQFIAYETGEGISVGQGVTLEACVARAKLASQAFVVLNCGDDGVDVWMGQERLASLRDKYPVVFTVTSPPHAG